MSLYDLDLTCDLAVVILSFKVLSDLYLRNRNMLKVETWEGKGGGGGGYARS